MPETKLAVIAAGGTGGHLFPAQALAEALKARGWRIVLATDDRVGSLTSTFPAEDTLALSTATFRRGDLVGMIRAILAIRAGVVQAQAAFQRLRPQIVIGFGGYPSLPALIGAILQGRRTLIHEQNAVSGRANRRLAPFVTAIACAFPTLLKASRRTRDRAVVVGNPVRPEIRALAGGAYAPPGQKVRILITGGSQGARLISEHVPAALGALPKTLRDRLEVQQQTRPESIEIARALYARAGVNAEIAPFFQNMAARLAAAHLVIGRSGASTVCELAVAGRPSILVPLKVALDNDQGQNARVLADVGGAIVMSEDAVASPRLAEVIEQLLTDPARLTAMAAAAKAVANPDAAERLADLVERVAG